MSEQEEPSSSVLVALAVEHPEFQFSHCLGLVCGYCPEADQPRYSANQIADLRKRLAAVLAIDPEDHATKSRDYGRGFAEAIRLVREAGEQGG